MLKGLTVIIFFQLCGEALVAALHSPIPGPVAGMLLLWLGLALRGGPSAELDEVGSGLIRYLSLFFLPAGVGLFFLPDAIQRYWPAVLAAMVVGTFVSMLFSGWLIKCLSGNRS